MHGSGTYLFDGKINIKLCKYLVIGSHVLQAQRLDGGVGFQNLGNFREIAKLIKKFVMRAKEEDVS